MALNQATPSCAKVFTFAEDLEEGTLQAHSYGNGRFIRGLPSKNCQASFSLHKPDENSLIIQIYDGKLFDWLCTIPNLCDEISKTLEVFSISMNTLLPYYPDVRERFAQYKREGGSHEAVELFVRHFLREGSTFAIFGFENLHENGILTELHFHDIQSQFWSISEDLDLLDEAIDKLEAEDIKGRSSTFLEHRSQFQLRTSITRRDPLAVEKVLATYPGVVDAKILCLAIRFYERTVFQLLLERGAEVDGAKNYGPLYCAAKAGHLDAVGLLLSHGADKEGRCSWDHPTPLTGAASAGHLDIVKYLVEEKGAEVNGNGYKSPLSGALKHCHTHVVDYLRRAGAVELDPKSRSFDYALALYRKTIDASPPPEYAPPSVEPLTLASAVLLRDVNAVERLINAGADVNPTSDSPPLCVAASRGYLEIVRLLVSAGANINSQKLGQVVRSPLAAAAKGFHAKVVRFLSSTGATLLQGEYRLQPWADKPWTVRDLLKVLRDSSGWDEDDEDQEDCPAVAAIRAQERRTTTRRLFAQVASSRKEVLDVGASQHASVSLREFVAQVGTVSSVFKSGTRAIRDISEGYKPSGLGAIVSALQVADAMRSVVPPSKLVYSKKEFLDDIPRWASLLSPDDQRLFDEIAHHLWGVPGSKTTQEGATNFAWDETVMFLQELVNNLVSASVGSGISCNPYRLQRLRQKHLSARGHTSETRLPLTEWCPSPTPEVQRSVHSSEPKSPDQDGEISTLARITILMAGAIFGVILLYLCLSQYDFSIPSLPLLASKTGQGWASSNIVARNCVILAMYIRFTSVVDSVGWKSNGNVLPDEIQMPLVLPDTSTTERVQEHVGAGQSSYDGDYMMTDFPSVVDYTMEDGRSDCSPRLSSNLMTSQSTTTILASTESTATPGSSTMGTSEDGTIQCQHCKTKFTLGKKGRSGQAGNFRKHMKSHHPEKLPNYQRVLHECRWGCGAKNPQKSNIEAHEKRYCAKTKGKQPRRHGKWRDANTGTF